MIRRYPESYFINEVYELSGQPHDYRNPYCFFRSKYPDMVNVFLKGVL